MYISRCAGVGSVCLCLHTGWCSARGDTHTHTRTHSPNGHPPLFLLHHRGTLDVGDIGIAMNTYNQIVTQLLHTRNTFRAGGVEQGLHGGRHMATLMATLPRPARAPHPSTPHPQRNPTHTPHACTYGVSLYLHRQRGGEYHLTTPRVTRWCVCRHAAHTHLGLIPSQSTPEPDVHHQSKVAACHTSGTRTYSCTPHIVTHGAHTHTHTAGHTGRMDKSWSRSTPCPNTSTPIHKHMHIRQHIHTHTQPICTVVGM